MSHSDDAIQQQQEEEQRYEVERVVELACKGLSPNDAATLRWASGIVPEETDKAQMPLGWGSDSSAKC